MAQTTDQVSMGCGKLEISINNTDWTDISGTSQSIEGTEATRMTGEAYTFDGDTALIGGGKREPMELTCNIVYTETDADGYEVTRNIFETVGCDTEFYVRWSPRGGSAGDEQITTGEGRVVGFTYPPMDASAGGPIMAAFTVKVPGVATTIIAS